MMSTSISKRRREGSRAKIKSMGDHKEFLKRITKTLYYGQLPTLPCLSLPVTEVSCELWSAAQRGRSLRRLHADAAAGIARSACVSPCALVLAILYLERLNSCNPDYIATTAPTDLFLVSLMVGNKFLQDDGEDDEVICSEWAASGGLELDRLKRLEVEFLSAIDWNVFVSDKSFESGLAWLEKQVALRQAQLRGFFTYSELAAGGAGASAAPLLRALSGAWLALVGAYAAALAAALLAAHALPLVALPHLALRHALAPAPLTAIVTSAPPSPSSPTANLTADQPLDDVLDIVLDADLPVAGAMKCCTRWMTYREGVETKRTWFDGVVLYDWKSFEPWWSKTSVLNWLYQSSLVDPMQRWLERSAGGRAARAAPCGRACARRRLGLADLGALAVSVSDR